MLFSLREIAKFDKIPHNPKSHFYIGPEPAVHKNPVLHIRKITKNKLFFRG